MRTKEMMGFSLFLLGCYEIDSYFLAKNRKFAKKLKICIGRLCEAI